MSAILSADDLNDFITPGVACIKPVETLPKKDSQNPEVGQFEVLVISACCATSNDRRLICNFIRIPTK